MDEALGRRITDYLIKPVNPSQVFLACKRIFDAQKLQESQRARDYVGEMQRWQSLDLRRLDWSGWVELAQDVARWDVRFDRIADAGLRQAHADFRRGLNIDFGRFVEEMLACAEDLQGELRASLREELAGAWDEFREEYEEVPPADTDMKHNPFLIIR